jgi:hypothetical protein
LVRTTLCTLQKDWSFLLQILPRKVHFWMRDQWCLFLLCQFKHNDGYLCLWQGLLVLFWENGGEWVPFCSKRIDLAKISSNLV